MAGYVADACVEVIAAGAVGTAALNTARARLWDSSKPVLTVDQEGTQQADLHAYGDLMWLPLLKQPADVAVFAPAELRGPEAITLLSRWLMELDAEGAENPAPPQLTAPPMKPSSTCSWC